ncbi:hypothetical protein NP493_703g00014 [Ridgeia piscesae]|uniref:Uncharacterized protein n=1 Tax=Ridgeia piscesae TaxID=27915 RepID=A0AAD9KR36_RIDPI|nr:hypothetical protein NP493_703g00014 [Ridgeia piscesae]
MFVQHLLMAVTTITASIVIVETARSRPWHNVRTLDESRALHGRRLRNREKKSKKPNIVFILTDDQDVELGSMNFMRKTLRILRDGGATFPHAYVTTPMCCPSRSSMLTGMYVHNHNTYTNKDNCSSLQWRHKYETRNFGTYLTNAGYRTGFFGKYLNEYDGEHIPPGWTEWMGLIRNSRFYNYSVNFNGRKEKHKDDYNNDYLTDLITNNSLTFLERSKQFFPDRPVAMVLSMPAPHGPEDAAPQYQHKFKNVTTHRTPSWNFAPNPDKQWILQFTGKMEPIQVSFTDLLHRKRLQTLQSVDSAVQRVYDELRRLGELSNTYFIYTSDHGYHLGQYGLVKGKAMPYEFDVKVPFYMRGPGIPAGVMVPNIVLNVDIAPTLLDIAGVDPQPHMDGMSVLKLFEKATEPGGRVGNMLKRKKVWRDTFLIERGKITPKKLKQREQLEAQKNDLQGSKDRKLQQECEKAEYQPPCQGDQRWVCKKFPGQKFRIYKCRTNQRQNEVGPFGKCRCPRLKLGTDKHERQRQRQFLRGHVNQPRMLKGRYLWRTQGRMSSKEAASINPQVSKVAPRLDHSTNIPKFGKRHQSHPRRTRRERRDVTGGDLISMSGEGEVLDTMQSLSMSVTDKGTDTSPDTMIDFTHYISSFLTTKSHDHTETTTSKVTTKHVPITQQTATPPAGQTSVALPVTDAYTNLKTVLPDPIENDKEFAVRCRVLPNNTVSCADNIYNHLDVWKAQKLRLDIMIEYYKTQLNKLRDIRQHLKSQRPLAGHTDGSREGGKKTEVSDRSHSDRGQKTEVSDRSHSDRGQKTEVSDRSHSDRGQKTEVSDRSHSDRGQKTNTHTAEESKQSTVTEDKVTNPSENVIQQSTDSPAARPQDSRRTSSPTVATATLHAMTVSYKQTTPAIAMDAEPTVAVTQATDAVAMVTDEGVRVEAGVPYQSEFGVDLDEEECDCDMEEYGEDEIEPPDTYSSSYAAEVRRQMKWKRRHDRVKKPRQKPWKIQKKERKKKRREERKAKRKLYASGKVGRRRGGKPDKDCDRVNMKCFVHDNDHWKTPPLWKWQHLFRRRKAENKAGSRRQTKRKYSPRFHPMCTIEGLECVRMDNAHWKVAPKWTRKCACMLLT